LGKNFDDPSLLKLKGKAKKGLPELLANLFFIFLQEGLLDWSVLAA